MAATDSDISKWFKSGAFVPPTVEDLNKLIPTCEILEFIDRGGMGAVYKARQRSLNRVVAVKVLPPAHQDKRNFAERFKREITALAMLNHPHIVSIYDSGEAEGGLLYYVMEFVDGPTLLRRMDRGAMGPRQKLNTVIQICEALQYAHDKGVIHRDIKPSNILVDSNDCVKIADFGLAKMLLEESPSPMLTGTGDAVGTPEYVAPEVLNGEHPVDHRADIYSLGVMLYYMLTGHTPKGVWEPPSACGADKRLDEVVNRMLQRDPGDRYQKATDLTNVLDDVLRQETNKIQSPPVRRNAPAGRTADPDAPTLYLNQSSKTAGWKKKAATVAVVAALAAGAFAVFHSSFSPGGAASAGGNGEHPKANSYDAREFAAWIFGHGGFLNATWAAQPEKNGTSEHDIHNASGLPDGDFTIWRVNFVEDPSFNDADLADLVSWCQRAGTVTNIGLQSTAVTPAGMASLPKIADTLVNLDIEHTSALSEESLPSLLACVKLDQLRLTLRYKVDLPPGAVPDEELVERIKRSLPNVRLHAGSPQP